MLQKGWEMLQPEIPHNQQNKTEWMDKMTQRDDVIHHFSSRDKHSMKALLFVPYCLSKKYFQNIFSNNVKTDITAWLKSLL